MYCSDECAIQDVYHKKSCLSKVACKFNTFEKFMMEAVEIVGDLDSMVGLLADDSKKTVFDFDLSDPDDPMYKKNLLIAFNGLKATADAEVKEIASQSTEFGELSTEIPLKLRRIFNTNAYDMSAVCGKGVGKPEKYGEGIFPFLSLLNHSCYPNVTHITVDNKFVLTVSRPIKAGEQIFITYGYSSVSYTLEERKKGLARYKFTCDCIACIEDYPKNKNLPKDELCVFKEPPKSGTSKEDTVEIFKMNCNLIEKNIKKHPTYEIMQLIDINRALLHGLVGL